MIVVYKNSPPNEVDEANKAVTHAINCVNAKVDGGDSEMVWYYAGQANIFFRLDLEKYQAYEISEIMELANKAKLNKGRKSK